VYRLKLPSRRPDVADATRQSGMDMAWNIEL
jgi:hypothetical protein